MRIYAYGFPRIGKNREYKKSIESFWKKEITSETLKSELEKLDFQRSEIYKKYDAKYPIGEMTLYDNMLDAAVMVGLYENSNLDDYYGFCRGEKALEMRKWFNTNYHYLVPEFDKNFSPSSFKPVKEKLLSALKSNPDGVSYLIGPYTFLKLSKGIKKKNLPEYMSALAGVYCELVKDLGDVHIDEPAFVTDVRKNDVLMIKEAYKKITSANKNIFLFSYYESCGFVQELYDLPLKGIGLDFVNGQKNLSAIKKYGFPDDKILVAGIVNGRNVWKTDVLKSVKFLKKLSKSAKNIMISNASPLYHLPVTVKGEESLSDGIFSSLAFAEERLYELKLIADCFSDAVSQEAKTYNTQSLATAENSAIKSRVASLSKDDFIKSVSLEIRRKRQQDILNLPLFPTTTIGSFPQTREVRSKRADFRAGRITKEEYGAFIREKIRGLVEYQLEAGLDVLVHGEYERTDMVEFFAEKLDGIATTKNGWIISYGTRGYRPPIIYGDVSRPAPMSVEEISFAQSISSKPVKGMLTGPVTIISWSFAREDIPISEVAYQIALCLQDEIKDYEKSGIKIVQIDEPAFREKAPIKKKNWPDYFEWAVNSFNLASMSLPETQIHTHMCYSAFGEIIDQINRMDFDKITIEASRSRGDIIKSFEKINFRKQIGIGVWDIHSPKVPSVKEMEKIVKRSLKVIPKENFWINPDCGLKTRDWPETKESLKNLVVLALKLRRKFGPAN